MSGVGDEPVRLTADLLSHYEGLLAAQGYPLDRFLPGLTDEAMDEATSPYGLVLAEETRVWYRWHNGELPRDASRDWRGLGFGSVWPVPLAQALQDRLMWRDIAAGVSSDWDKPSDEWWSPAWLPFLQGMSDTRVCDAPPTPSTTTAVRWIAPHQMQPTDFWVIRAASLGDMVTLWITAMSRGWLRFDPTDQWWHHSDDIPYEVLTTALV